MGWTYKIQDSKSDSILHHRFPYHVIVANADSYFNVFGKWPNVYEPKTYGEKIFWRKLFDRNPKFIDMSDKFHARKFVSDAGFDHILKPLTSTINPNDVVHLFKENTFLQMSNACGLNKKINKIEDIPSIELLKSWQENVYGYSRMEWTYLANSHRNQFLIEENLGDLYDIKVYCFDGFAKFCSISKIYSSNDERINTRTGKKACFVSRSGEQLHIRTRFPQIDNWKLWNNTDKHIEESFYISEKLSIGFDHIRVDFLSNSKFLWFSEFTFYPRSGLDPFINTESEIGDMWSLNMSHAVDYLPGETPYV